MKVKEVLCNFNKGGDMPGWAVDDVIETKGSPEERIGKWHITTDLLEIQELLGGFGLVDHPSHKHVVEMYIDDVELATERIVRLMKQHREAYGRGRFAMVPV